MDDEEIDVVNFDAESEKSIRRNEKAQEGTSLACDECDYVGRTKSGLSAHRRHKHPKPEDSAKKPRAQNARKRKELKEDEPERVTTKQLLGGRKRPKTVVENVEELSGIRALPKPGPELKHANMSVGEYAARKVTGYPLDGNIDEIGGAMVVGEEVVIDGDEMDGDPSEIPMITQFISKKYISRQRRPDRLPIIHDKPNHISNRIVHGDDDGKYICYIKNCNWKGNYRSLRMDHMKTIHPDWKMPSRYILQRITKEGVYLDPDTYKPPIKCRVQGCDWAGNYRASRSAHMKKMHPEEHAESKKKLPGYNCNGTYLCRFPNCSWRGWSRSTRSQHMKKDHPTWRPEDSRHTTLLTCFYCKSSLSSYPHLVSHVDQHGGVGLHVDQIFEGKDIFAAWLDRIEGIYQITFERTDLPNDDRTDYVHYVLHCSCVGGRGIQIAADSRNFIYQTHNFLKRRTQQFLTRNKNDCSAHLEIYEYPLFDKITVKGSLEHTGHRFGTPLIRMSPMDRQLYAEILEAKNHEDFRVPALDVVEKLNTCEGFQMDNFAPPEAIELIEPLDEDPMTSLRKIIIHHSDQECFFGVDFVEDDEGRTVKCAFGYMSPEMKRLWSEFGPARVVTLDVNLLEFDGLEIFQFSVIVNDDQFVPKCALIYISTEQDLGYDIVLEQLKSVDDRSPMHLMCDPSEAWMDTFEKVYPEIIPPILISEWTLMDYWAARTELVVENEFDVYCIVTALRRLLRTEDVHQFMFFVIELFEALYECGYDRLAEFLDTQLSDLDYFKRWSPCHRDAFTSHSHPTLAVSSFALRNLYLTTEHIDRVDQWFVHATKRIAEFNAVQTTQTFTLRPMDTRKKYFYESINVQEFHKQVDSQEGEIMVYEEDVEDVDEMVYEEGVEVVEEEVIGEEMMYQEVMAKDPRRMEHQLQLQHQELQEHQEHRGHQDHQREDDIEILMRRDIPAEEEEEPIEEVIEDSVEPIEPRRTLSEPIEPVEDSEEPLDDSMELQNQPSTSTAPPYHARRKKELSPSPTRQGRATPKKRDTTRSVVRGSRKKKDRFAELRDCPPEVMKAIAAHAIAYDGRKKEQRPYMHLPSQASLGTGATPVIPTPDLKPFIGAPIPTKAFLAARKNPNNPDLKITPSMVPPPNWGTNKAMIQERPPPRRRHIIIDHRQPSTSSSSSHMHHQHHPMNFHHQIRLQHHQQLQHQHQQLQHQYLDPESDDEDQLRHQHDDQQPCTSASLYN